MNSLWGLVFCAAAIFQITFVRCAPTPIVQVETAELERRASTITSVDQRLFKINGKTQYFAGMKNFQEKQVFANKIQEPIPGGSVTFFQTTMWTLLSLR